MGICEAEPLTKGPVLNSPVCVFRMVNNLTVVVTERSYGSGGLL